MPPDPKAKSSAAAAEPFRLLGRPAKMETIARARLITLDSQPAFIQMDLRVLRVNSLSVAPTGGETRSIALDNVGLIVGITPRIDLDGAVTMQIDVEQSQLAPEQEGIPISVAGGKVVRSPRIDATTIQGTVRIPNAQTVILGSVARKREQRTGDHRHAARHPPGSDEVNQAKGHISSTCSSTARTLPGLMPCRAFSIRLASLTISLCLTSRPRNSEQTMLSRKATFAGKAALLVLVARFVVVPSLFAQGRQPIVDIRFDAPHSQVGNSIGDEWAPTWADDDNLYTGNDDGSSFGGIPSRSVAFGKLVEKIPTILSVKR